MLESHNSIKLYNGCEFAYYLKYRKQQRIIQYNDKVIIGMILHSFLEQYFKKFTIKKNINYLKYKDKKNIYFIKKNFYNLNKIEIDKIFRNFQKIIKSKEFLSIKNIKGIKKTEVKIVYSDKFIGNIDLLIKINDSKYFLLDYKSGNPYFQNFNQLDFYGSILFQNNPKLKEIILIEYYVNYNKLFKKLYLKPQGDIFFQKSLNKYKEIKENKENKFFKKNTEQCRICMYKEHCKVYTYIQNIKKELLNKSIFNKKIFIATGNYSSKKVIVLSKPTIKQFNENVFQHELFNYINKSDYLIIFADYNFSNKKELNKKYQESTRELLKFIEPDYLYFENDDVFKFVSKNNKTYDKNFLLSLDKEKYVKSYILNNDYSKIGAKYV